MQREKLPDKLFDTQRLLGDILFDSSKFMPQKKM